MNKPEQPISVVLVEDHAVTRAELRALLDQFKSVRVIGDAATAKEGVRIVSELSPDVVLLDIRLPDGSGFDALRQLREAGCESKVLFLTSFDDDDLLFEALGCGADGYLLKQIEGERLVSSLKTVVAGHSILDPSVTRRVLSRVKLPQRDNKADFDRLSAQERKVLSLVADGMTNKEIGAALGLSGVTVRNYLANAMEKLNVTRRAQAAVIFNRNS